jgi:cytochrome c oxidase subunit 1
MNEKLGIANFILIFAGFNLTFFPMHFLGLFGMPRRTYRYDDGLGWDGLNQLATVGAFVIALGALVLIVNILVSRRHGELAPDDAWDGRTLEWSIPSPPPEYNFAEIPEVHSRDDFWHRKYTEDAQGYLVPIPAGGATEAPVAAEHGAGADGDAHDSGGQGAGGHGSGGHGIHMPSPSYWPLVVGFSAPILGYAAVYKEIGVAVVGAIVFFFAMMGWMLEPADEPDSVAS